MKEQGSTNCSVFFRDDRFVISVFFENKEILESASLPKV